MDPRDPQQPPEPEPRPAGDEPTGEQPATEQPPPAPAPKRLFRSERERVLGGVCGGIAEYFGIDVVIVRVAAVALVAFGGAGLLIYLAAWLLVPAEGTSGQDRTGAQRAAVIAGAVALVIAAGALLPHGLGWGGFLVPLGWLALAGLLVWWVVTGRRPDGGARDILRRAALGIGVILVCGLLAVGGAWAGASGGGAVVAGIVIAAGVALVAGAFVGGARWLILSALAVALPLAVVSAADVDVSGGVGQREYRPASANAIRPDYKLGVGRLVVDLRGAHLPPGDVPVKLRLGVGQAQLLVPDNVCVATDASAGVGDIHVLGRDTAGIDVARDDRPAPPAGTTRVLLDAHVGIGAVEVHHRLPEHRGFHGRYADDGVGNRACSAGGTA